MKGILSATLSLLFATLLFTACDDREINPVNDITFIPVRLEEPGYTLELTYDDKGQLQRTKATGQTSDKQPIVTLQEMFYDASGKLVKSTKDDEWMTAYYYENDAVVRMDEFYKGAMHLDHRFTYDNLGRIVEIVAWKADGVPYSKTVNTWDINGNLVMDKHYEFSNGSFQLSYIHTYSGYDDKISADLLFNTGIISRTEQHRQHNPAKMEVKNADGMVSLTEEYTYRYHEKGYPIERTTFVTLWNGNSGSYVTKYFYEERR
jgi:hypothetical protein